MRNGWTFTQFKIFRIFIGSYLFVHFVHLIPFAREIFSNLGALPEPSLSPLLTLFPNIFILNDSPIFIIATLVVGAIASIGIISGKHDKVCAAICAYLLACLLGRNPLILNPGMPYMGWILLFYLFIPTAKTPQEQKSWTLPTYLYLTAFSLLAITYSYSGYTKLLSPAWVQGDTLSYVLDNPLARDTWFRVFMLSLPPICLKIITWGILYIELLFAPLALSKALRPWIWLSMLFIQFGFLVCLNFADLTFPMLMMHFITFDPNWLSAKVFKPITLFYDGTCGFCHRTVQFILKEDKGNLFQFAPIQGQTIQAMNAHHYGLNTMVILDDKGRQKIYSDAVISIGWHLGGLYRVGAALLWLVPKPLRDSLYKLNGQLRHHYFPQPDVLCPFVTAEEKLKFLE